MIGILRVVEEIILHRPDARIVINSIFPMTAARGGLYPLVSDYEDSLAAFGHVRSLAAFAPSVTSDASVLHLRRHRWLRMLRSRGPEVPVQVMRARRGSEVKAGEVAGKEEVLSDNLMMKDRRFRPPPAQINPVMTDRTKIRKYELGTPLIKKSDRPLWTSIRAINKELRKFAEKHDRVTFFDATSLFTEKVGPSYKLLTDRISVRGHPTENGFVAWEDEIVKKVEQMLAAMKREQPELFKNAATVKADAEIASNNNNNGTGIADDDVARQHGDDLDDSILHPNDDGFGQRDEAADEATQESIGDGDDDNDVIVGDLRVTDSNGDDHPAKDAARDDGNR